MRVLNRRRALYCGGFAAYFVIRVSGGFKFGLSKGGNEFATLLEIKT